MLALACSSSTFAQVPLPPVTPADSAAKAAAIGPAPAGAVEEMVSFDSKSRWHLTVNAIDQFGLVITGASFQKSPNSPFIYVLFDGRLAEIFVPYHEGFRFFDIGGPQGPYPPATLNPAQFPRRQIIGGGKICKEVRDYLAWMNYEGTPRVRYGQEVVYFSVLEAANYAYVEEWTFRDDGSILVRAGSTGPKLGSPGDPRGHMHNMTWRLDIDLNGAGGDSALFTNHRENFVLGEDSTATDGPPTLISVEQGLVWDPKEFNTLQVQDSTLQNGNRRRTTYELVPMRSGTARHSEAFTKNDFWVTRYDPQQSLLAKNLPNYVANRQPTVNRDIVVWYTGSEHHENHSRDEDFNTVPVLWTGFELIPNNLFDRTPFYPNP